LRDCLFGQYGPVRWRGGRADTLNISGELTGGNLSLIYSLIGTEAEPDTKDKILFIEDTGEYFYHLDRMMTSLRMTGLLEGLAALIVGGMNEMQDGRIPWDRSAIKTISDITSGYGYPVLYNFPAGHIADNRAFFIGRAAKLESDKENCILTFL
jgi:muramoyltetrapeptide carboxypeptidase